MKKFLLRLGVFITLGVVLLLVAIALPQRPILRTQSTKAQETVAAAWEIYTAILLYGDDHNHYPDAIEDLVAEGYLKAIPNNPYRTKDERRSMQSVPLWSEDMFGNYTYETFEVSGEPRKFLLLVYGYTGKKVRKGDQAWQHIVACFREDAAHLPSR